MEVKKLTKKELPFKFEGPLAGDKPVYIYCSETKDYLLYSTSLKNLLNSPEVKKPLKISTLGLSFYLLSGVIPTPYTVYENIFVLNVGDILEIKNEGSSFKFFYSHQFPFHSKNRKEKNFDEKHLLELLKKSVLKNLLPQCPIYLFQSLGKDSNTIALALSEVVDFKEKITCLTLSTGDRKDESQVASEVAKKLGFKHVKLFLPEKVTSELLSLFDYYFTNITHPCVDGTSLVYPIYAAQIDFRNTNIIDGSGNDIYFGHVPRAIEYKRQKNYLLFSFLRPISELLPTGNILQKLTKTRSEMIGLTGFTLREAKKIYPEVISVFKYWKEEDQKRKDWDYFDLKADIWGTNVEFDLVIRKVRNFAEVFEANLILPWTDPEIAQYIGNLKEEVLFDRKNFKNKLPLRKLLRERLGLDADAMGKYSYGFDAYRFLQKMEDKVKEEVFSCRLWNRKNIEKIYQKLQENSDKKLFKNLYTRLFILSAWFNHNCYLKSFKT